MRLLTCFSISLYDNPAAAKSVLAPPLSNNWYVSMYLRAFHFNNTSFARLTVIYFDQSGVVLLDCFGLVTFATIARRRFRLPRHRAPVIPAIGHYTRRSSLQAATTSTSTSTMIYQSTRGCAALPSAVHAGWIAVSFRLEKEMDIRHEKGRSNFVFCLLFDGLSKRY